MKIIEYKIVSDKWTIDLAGKVNELLQKGWTLYGAPCYENIAHYQAMVRYEEYICDICHENRIKQKGICDSCRISVQYSAPR